MRPIPIPEKGVFNMPGVCWYWARGVTTTSGALSTATQPGLWAKQPAVISKVAATAGRYKVQLPSAHYVFLGALVTLFGPASAAYGANTTGFDWFLRAENVDAVNGTVVDGSFLLQFTQTSYADAEVPDGTSFTVCIGVADGT